MLGLPGTPQSTQWDRSMVGRKCGEWRLERLRPLRRNFCRRNLALTRPRSACESHLIVFDLILRLSIYGCAGAVNPTDLSELAFPYTVNCTFLLQKLTGDWRGSRLPPWLAIRYRIVLRMRSYLTYTC
jgi:hypothetical protein